MLHARRREALVVVGAGPVREQIGPERPELEPGDFLGLVGRGPAREGCIHQIGERVEPRRRVRTRSKADIKRGTSKFILGRFIIHEHSY